MNSTINGIDKNVADEKIQQYFQESDSWRRLLDFLKEENAYMKIRLEHLVNRGISDNLRFNEKNLRHELDQKDQLIELNRSAVVSFQQWLNRRRIRSEEDFTEIIHRHTMIRGQIERTESKFSGQCATFNDQLTKNL